MGVRLLKFHAYYFLCVLIDDKLWADNLMGTTDCSGIQSDGPPVSSGVASFGDGASEPKTVRTREWAVVQLDERTGSSSEAFRGTGRENIEEHHRVHQPWHLARRIAQQDSGRCCEQSREAIRFQHEEYRREPAGLHSCGQQDSRTSRQSSECKPCKSFVPHAFLFQLPGLHAGTVGPFLAILDTFLL